MRADIGTMLRAVRLANEALRPPDIKRGGIPYMAFPLRRLYPSPAAARWRESYFDVVMR